MASVVRKLSSLADTEALATDIARNLKGGMTVGLCGELGAGKTTFTKALVKALGSNHEVSSPSYVLAHEYTNDTGLKIEHWDLYRVGQLPDELLEPVADKVVRVIEWADKFKSELGELDFLLKFSIDVDKNERKVLLVKVDR